MKTKNYLWLFVSLFLLIIPVMQMSAFADEVEIELMEVSGFLPGDNPLDDPDQGGGNIPPQPTDFRATITGSTLAVTSGTHATRVLVRNSVGTVVVDRQFVGGTMEQLSAGSYSLELQSGSLTLVGVFEAL